MTEKNTTEIKISWGCLVIMALIALVVIGGCMAASIAGDSDIDEIDIDRKKPKATHSATVVPRTPSQGTKTPATPSKTLSRPSSAPEATKAPSVSQPKTSTRKSGSRRR